MSEKVFSICSGIKEPAMVNQAPKDLRSNIANSYSNGLMKKVNPMEKVFSYGRLAAVGT